MPTWTCPRSASGGLLDQAWSHTDYLAAISPYFFAAPPEEGIYAYFRQLLLRSDLPLLLYNFPQHAQTDITPSIVSRLAHAHQLQADFDQWSDARRASPLTEIAFVKAALAARIVGFPPYVRPPLVTATAAQSAEIRGFLRRKMLPLINL